LLTTKWESNSLINSYDHDDYDSIYYFPISKFNENFPTLFDPHGLTSHYLGTCQADDALQPSLMVSSSPHYFEKTSEYD